jgi:cytochrome c biogenesis protein CcdA
MLTTTWQGGENIFRFTVFPLLPAASFYLGVVAIFAVVGAWISAFRSDHRYSRRQLWAFSASCLTLLIGLVVSSRTPIAFQSWIDSIPATN